MAYEYPEYVTRGVKLSRPSEGVLLVTMSRGKMNEMDFDLHHAMADIWMFIDQDPETLVAIVTGEGRAFSAGGAFDLEEKLRDSQEWRLRMWKDGRNMVHNMINCSKPVIAAINGAAAGGGLAVALMADITIAAKKAKIIDPHVKVGVAAGDHAAIIWPLLCSMAKAKYYLMLGEPILGEVAERIGLITEAVEQDEVMPRALLVAQKLAASSPSAIRMTKHAMNNWMRMAWPIFDSSLAMEILGFAGPDMAEGLAAFVEKREPKFERFSPA